MDLSFFTDLFDTPLHTVGQTVGGAALIIAVLSYQMKTRKSIVFMQILSCALFGAHFFLLGAYTGALLNVIAAIRAGVFYFKDKKWCKNAVFVPLFCVICVAAVAFSWEGALSLLPVAGMLFTTFSVASSTPKNVRLFALPSSPLWIVYNAASGSVAGVVTELIVMTSIISAIVRLDLRKGQKNGAGGGD